MATLLLTVRFLLELALGVAFVVATSGLLSGVVGWLLGGALAIFVYWLWGTLIGPKAPRRLAFVPRTALEAVFFVAATGLLAASGHWAAAAAFFVVWAVDTVLIRAQGITEEDFGR